MLTNYGKIYKIISIHTNEIYIGSTCMPTLDLRLLFHEECYTKWITKGYKRNYCSSFEIFKYGNYQIELLEDYPCLDIIELRKREGYYQLTNMCVNMNIAGNRPYSITIINTDPVYYCACCKKEIANTYSTRLLHLKTSLHRKNRNNVHRLFNFCQKHIIYSKVVRDIPVILERTLEITY